MNFLYAVKGCSHCDLRQGCDLKNHRETLLYTDLYSGKEIPDSIFKTIKEKRKIWKSLCKYFFREGSRLGENNEIES